MEKLEDVVNTRLFLDPSMLGMFANEAITLSTLFYPGKYHLSVKVFAKGGSRTFSADVWQLESIWWLSKQLFTLSEAKPPFLRSGDFDKPF